MTSKAIFYYTTTGKTEAVLPKEKISEYDIYKLNGINQASINFELYDTIIIGTPTYGRGVPPLYFKPLVPKLMDLNGKVIGLFGSGNSIYGDEFCGALDLLEEILQDRNKICFKFKFEGMPRESDIKN